MNAHIVCKVNQRQNLSKFSNSFQSQHAIKTLKFINHFSLAINLRMTSRKQQINLQFSPNNTPKVTKKLIISIKKTIVWGMSCNLTTSLKKKSATCVVSLDLWHAMKWVILLKLSIITNMLSRLFLVLGNLNTKSINISTQEQLGTGKGVYNPWDCTLDLTYLWATQLEQILSTFFFSY